MVMRVWLLLVLGVLLAGAEFVCRCADDGALCTTNEQCSSSAVECFCTEEPNAVVVQVEDASTTGSTTNSSEDPIVAPQYEPTSTGQFVGLAIAIALAALAVMAITWGIGWWKRGRLYARTNA